MATMTIPFINAFITNYFALAVSSFFFPVLNEIGTLLPAGETLTYPCISW